MGFLGRMNQVVEYIETHLIDDIDFNDLAGIVCCNVYQFGRVFTYVVGVPLSEYVRRRRLSQAAFELQGGKSKVIDVAMKYGYECVQLGTTMYRYTVARVAGLTLNPIWD